MSRTRSSRNPLPGFTTALLVIAFFGALPAHAAPVITKLSPTQAQVNTYMDIIGSGFGSTQGSSTVTINGTAANYFSVWASTQITIKVPSGATTGNVVVTVGGVQSNGVLLTIIPPPTISSISPSSGPAGTTVTITGTNLLGNSTLGAYLFPTSSFWGCDINQFNEQVTNVTNTSMSFQIWAGAQSGNIGVGTSDLSTNPLPFTLTSPTPPIADSGTWTQVQLGSTVQLDGSGSYDLTGRPLTYQWTVTDSEGRAVTLSDPTSPRPTFVAAERDEYLGYLVVNNGISSSPTLGFSGSDLSPSSPIGPSDNLAIEVAPQASGFSAQNPVPNPGPDQTVKVGSKVFLDGSQSTTVTNLPPLTYFWELVAAPAGSKAALSNPGTCCTGGAPNPTFIADVPGDYFIRLSNNDGGNGSQSWTPAVRISTTNSAPVANPGPPQAISTPGLIQLDGSGSTDVDGDPLTYSWSISSKPVGSTAVLSDATAVQPTFVADVVGTYVVQLIVNDGKLSSLPGVSCASPGASRRPTVTITDGYLLPVANAGSAQSVKTGSVVNLDGAQSTTGGSEVDSGLTYKWALVYRPPNSKATLSFPGSVTPYFTADIAGKYIAQLIVNDGSSDSNPSTVVISTDNSRPVANAGPHQFVVPGTTVQLSGAASSDADKNTLTYRWAMLHQPSGASATLSNSAIVNPSFVASVGGFYVVQLIVNDGQLDSPPATTWINVAPNQAPVVNAGQNQTINLPDNTITIEGAASDDGLPNPPAALTTSWTKVSGPGTVTFSSPSTAQTQATFSTFGTYVLQLSANDSQLTSTSNVTITVNPQPIVLSLTPLSAGPNVKGTTQTMTATLMNGSGPTATPISGVSVSFTVTGPNATTGSATTSSSGIATFTYTGTNSGTDTVTATYTGQNSNSANVTWLVPSRAVSTSPAFCQFFSTGFRPNEFTIAPGTTPAFTQSFPSVNFNAISVPGEPSFINQNTRPLFDVVTDTNGNYAGSIAAQGNGTSAGGGLFEFQMVCTGTFTVANAGSITFSIGSDDSMIFGVKGATIGSSNNALNGVSPGQTTAFFNFPIMGANDGPGTFLPANYVVNFPSPGNYPYEVDYVECCGFALFMNLNVGAGGVSSPTTGTLSLAPISPSSLTTGQTQTFTVQATDAGGAPAAGVAVALSVNGANQVRLAATTNSSGTATFQYSGTTPGADTIQASANVGGTAAYTGFANMTWTAPTGSTAVQFSSPGWIGSPGPGQVIQGQVPINIAGPCQCTLVSGTLTSWPTSNPSAVTTINATFPSSNNLGTFDGTVLASGGYTIQLNATASNGVKLNSQVNVSVVGNNKLGRMTSTVTEFEVPLAGIPISITRTYDSLDRSKIEDFGFGWKLGTFVDLSVDSQNNVTFNFNGQKVTFFFTPQPASFFGSWLSPGYTPQAGVHGSLISNGCGGLLRLGSGLVCFPSTGQTYQPTLYQYTDAIGRVYIITATGQLQSIQDLNGNTLTVTPTGITSSVNGVVVPFQRDGTGRISQITDLNGKIYTYTYDTSGNLQSVQYPGLTAAETYTYATDHSLLTEQDPNGNTSTATYYSSANDGGNALLDGRLQSVTGPSVSDANGNPTQYTTQYAYNLSTNATTITNPDGGTVTRTDDAFGNPMTIVESVNSTTTRTTTNQYDANENLTKVVRPCGNTACSDTSGNDTYQYTYDANGFQTSIQDPLGHTSHKIYNSVGGVLTATDAANTNTQTTTYDGNFNPLQTTDLLNGSGTFVSSSTFDALGNLLTSTDSNSKTTQYAYDPNGNLIQVTDALNEITHYGYDGMGRVITQTDALGNVTKFAYDSLGRLNTKTDAMGNVTTYGYDNNGNKTSETDANQNKTQYQYDALNRLTLITYPDTTTRQYRYDFRGNKLVEIDQLGRKRVYTYDLAGELLTDTFASGTADAGTVTYTYDLDGRQSTVKDELNNTTTNTYDAAGNLLTVTDALTNVTTYGYDSDNRKTSVQDANHNTTSYAYDKRSRLGTVTYPATATQGVTTTQYTYDGVGRQLTTTDQAGQITTKTYDAVGRLSSVKDAILPNGNITRYTYDFNGNLKFLQDAAGRVTSYQYDPLNRRNTRTLPLNQQELYTYDPVGNLATHTDFNGLKTTYAYDKLNRLLSKTPSSGTAISFTYTATGQRLTMTDPSGTTNYSSYDNRDRLLTKATPEGTLTYTYDAHGNVTSIVSSNANGANLGYQYDALNRLAKVCDNRIAPGCGTAGVTTYGYDPVGNLNGYAYPNTVQTANVFDQLNRLTQTCSATSSPACSASTKLSSYAYTLGNSGNRTAVGELNGRNVAYGYDNDYRLKSEAITADPSGNNGAVNYVYDVVGNRSSMTSTLNAVPGGSFFVDENDRLTTDTYDNNGNTISSTGIANTYDFENRMLKHGAITLVYDGDGNRVSETIGGTTTKYLVDDHNPTNLPQVLDEIAGGSVTRTYAYGLQRLSENQQISGTFTPSFYGYDGHGNVRFLTNSAGANTDSYDYDAFGMPVKTSGTTANQFLYSGERDDSSVGLYDLRARYYNQATGRFWASDAETGSLDWPASIHKYVYTENEPIDFNDPTGREALQELALKIYTSTIQGIYTDRPIGQCLNAAFGSVGQIIQGIASSGQAGNAAAAGQRLAAMLSYLFSEATLNAIFPYPTPLSPAPPYLTLSGLRPPSGSICQATATFPTGSPRLGQGGTGGGSGPSGSGPSAGAGGAGGGPSGGGFPPPQPSPPGSPLGPPGVPPTGGPIGGGGWAGGSGGPGSGGSGGGGGRICKFRPFTDRCGF